MKEAKRKRLVSERRRVRDATREQGKATAEYAKLLQLKPTWLNEPAWYREYLKTSHWREFKERYKRSGRPRFCIICKARRYELHHITYERIGDERLGDVVALCRKHHSRAHKREKEGVPLREAHLETTRI